MKKKFQQEVDLLNLKDLFLSLYKAVRFIYSHKIVNFYALSLHQMVMVKIFMKQLLIKSKLIMLNLSSGNLLKIKETNL